MSTIFFLVCVCSFFLCLSYLLLRLLYLLLSDLLTDGRFLHTKDIGTSLGQLLQAALDVQAGSVHLLLDLTLSDVAVSLLQPAGVQQADSHVLLHLTGWDLLTRDGGDEVLVRGSHGRQRLRG